VRIGFGVSPHIWFFWIVLPAESESAPDPILTVGIAAIQLYQIRAGILQTDATQLVVMNVVLLDDIVRGIQYADSVQRVC